MTDVETKPEDTANTKPEDTVTDNVSFLITLQKISSKVFLLDFLAKHSGYKIYLCALWIGLAAIIYSISFAKDEKNKKIRSQHVFLLQCSAVWILLLAFSFLFVMK